MMVRKCDPLTARELPKTDRQKLLAIVTLDSIEDPSLIQKALAVIMKLSEEQKGRANKRC